VKPGRVLALLLPLVLGAGCSYYNGMYNAKRLAGRARKAEREGRTLEATSLWGQVAVKAESAAVRHPRKNWSDEARLLHGTALVRLRDCTRALAPLQAVMHTGRDADQREQAALMVGQCLAQVGDPAGSAAAYARLAGSRDPARRRLAGYQYGRALRLEGRYNEALEQLALTDDPHAPGERGATLAAMGRVSEAVAIADSLILLGDTLTPWDTLLAWIGRADPQVASSLTDRVTEANLPPVLKARLLIQDGIRLLDRDAAAGGRRLQAAGVVGRGTPAQAEVRFESARAGIARATTAEGLRQASELLDDVGEGGGFAVRATQLRAMSQRLLSLLDSAGAGNPRGDLRLFLAGELARDSLEASGFAAIQFRRLAEEWPESPFVPKALLALIPLQPGAADSLRTLLLERFSESPYLAVIQGGESPRYLVLEDSLRQFALTLRGEGWARPPERPDQPIPAQPQPTPARQPVEN
jgi:tetratricopeptide (TPR) repeat protein